MSRGPAYICGKPLHEVAPVSAAEREAGADIITGWQDHFV